MTAFNQKTISTLILDNLNKCEALGDIEEELTYAHWFIDNVDKAIEALNEFENSDQLRIKTSFNGILGSVQYAQNYLQELERSEYNYDSLQEADFGNPLEVASYIAQANFSYIFNLIKDNLNIDEWDLLTQEDKNKVKNCLVELVNQ
jgi:hypothetical protein